jgi:hypothetical protein
MPLNCNYNNIADQSLITNPHVTDEYHPVAYALSMMSTSCGFSKITKDNAANIYQRIKACQAMHGAFIHKKRETNSVTAVYITQRDVEAYVGLTTNASTLTDAAFGKRVMEWMKDYKLPRNEGILSDGFLERTAIDIIAEKK